MDEDHLAAAFRYVMRNPVEAGMVAAPERWPWSSAAAYLKARDDGLTKTKPMHSRFPDMRGLLTGEDTLPDDLAVRDDETIGRPRGDAAFVKALEKKTGRSLLPGKRGPKAKGELVAAQKPRRGDKS